MAALARLADWRVLVPRDGAWGGRVAALLEAEGAEPVVAPLIRTEPEHSPELRAALAVLATGGFDWVVVTSAAAVDVLRGAKRASTTRVAAVGPATAAALAETGIRVDLTPEREYSAHGMLDAWPAEETPARVLILHSDLAAATLADVLRDRGHAVEEVVAYRTIALPLDGAARAALAGPGLRAALVTSGSVARALAAARLPAGMVIACLGPGTAEAAIAAGLPVALVAPERSATALVEALGEYAAGTSSERESP